MITSTDIFDPFIDEDVEVKLFKAWMLQGKEEFEKYEEELETYRDLIPEFMFKSADKYILQLLELYKSAEIKEPAKTFHRLLVEVIERLVEFKKSHIFIDVIFSRLDEDIELISSLSSPERKEESWKKLKERGFIGN